MSRLRIAVVGATGAVGQEMLRVLEQRGIGVEELRAFASPPSRGAAVVFRGEPLPLRLLEPGCFRGLDFALFSAGAERSRQYAPQAVQEGAVVVDNSSAFRLDAAVPLVVPEVNASALDGHRGLVANPNCSTIQMVVALKPVRDLFGLRRVVVATYQSVSGAGRRSMGELEAASRAYLAGTPEPREVYPRGIAFDVVPHIDVLDAAGWSREETKMRQESRKILGMPELRLSATCVRVPVFRCHSEAVHVETESPVDLEALRTAMQRQPGLALRPEADYPLARELAGRDEVGVGRLRLDPQEPRSLAFWVVSDNLRKGAALNAVQIVEHLCQARVRGGT
ncbi:MAG TPA: aspartate-semialdehyde dehydrogenase [Candidatus Krumholzibacteria bacterium]|nr:aspartate-semialdehyde dehydrogenase [Candidatus Krumholzibacteria bacterium]